jgi:hypothetical protein
MNLQEIADRLAIRELIERYSLSVTRRDWETIGACFHPESRWCTAPPMSRDFRTQAAIQKGLAEMISASEFLVQMAHGVVIDELTAERAKATTVLNEVGRRSTDKAGLFVLGVYHDVITKVDGRWGFEERCFEGYYIDNAWLPGNVLVDYATRR